MTDFSDYLKYDPDTGVITWKKYRNNRHKAKKIAGSPHIRGYLVIGFKGKVYYAQRLAWLLHYGEWPSNQIDHINGIRNDNRIANLRLVSARGNSSNKKIHREGKLVGASYEKKLNRYCSVIEINKKYLKIGRYPTELEAHKAYMTALKFVDYAPYITKASFRYFVKMQNLKAVFTFPRVPYIALAEKILEL